MSYDTAIEDLYIVNCVDNWDHSNPKETLATIIRIEIEMALDPLISTAAVELIEKYGGCYNVD